MTLLDRLMDHLRAQSLVRRPDEAGAGPRPWDPPFWRHPKDGAPAPGEKGRSKAGAIAHNEADDGLVVSAFQGGQIPPGAGQGYSRRRIIDIHLRAAHYPTIEAFTEDLEEELGPAPYGIRFDWVMGGLYVIESRMWNGLSPITASEGQGLHHRVAFLFETLT